MALESFYSEDQLDVFVDLTEWVESHLDWEYES
mgnify:CR=1 FL=1